MNQIKEILISLGIKSVWVVSSIMPEELKTDELVKLTKKIYAK